VQESVQDALLLILQRLGSYRGDSRFTTWAMSVATRLALSELRRARWKDVSLDQMAAAGRPEPPAPNRTPAGTDYDREQLVRVVHEAIDATLTERQRTAILAELAEAPPDVIAARLGTSRNALYKLVFDGRAKLKQAILKAGWSEEHVRDVLARR
jgi:RNA polymerase sigma-70 factor (ECF subfamily)